STRCPRRACVPYRDAAPHPLGTPRRQSAANKFDRAEGGSPPPPLEELDGALVSQRLLAGVEGAEVAPLARLRVLLARVEAIAAGRQLADHPRVSFCPACRAWRRRFARSSSRRCRAGRFAPARLMKYWTIRIAEPSPFGLTFLVAITRAIVAASFANN